MRYRYEEDGILPNGSTLPEIPVMNLVFVRRDVRRGLAGETVVDTGFDESIYANTQLAEFLEGSMPVKTADLQTLGHRIRCEVYKVECYLADADLKLSVQLREVDIHVPGQVGDPSEDVIVGRAILNRYLIRP
ncbi:hypothetical protein KEJ39_03480, partial [Candidatus Bathyarchaeota archaeon]|nr:hypothetical protein [Candidatus Bathyarchaeota archaeon]